MPRAEIQPQDMRGTTSCLVAWVRRGVTTALTVVRRFTARQRSAYPACSPPSGPHGRQGRRQHEGRGSPTRVAVSLELDLCKLCSYTAQSQPEPALVTFVDRVSDSALRLPQPERAFTPTLATGMPRATRTPACQLASSQRLCAPQPTRGPPVHSYILLHRWTRLVDARAGVQ